jgi:murein DD-endopeptidase MepM/ murein hydrolase activator NlpD
VHTQTLRAGLAIVSSALLSATIAAAQPLSIAVRSRAVQQGELLLVTVTSAADAEAVSVSAFDREWPTERIGTSTWRALVGIDMDQRPGRYTLAVTTGQPPDRQSRTITVLRRQYPRRLLTVQPEFVNPPPAELERITHETAFLNGLYAQSAHDPLATTFVRPVPGVANSSFGSRSVFNGQPRSPHAGTDFLSGMGTPIHAPAAGRIVAARDLFFTGNTVVIDHGLGVVSLLAHMSKIDVDEGQTVHAGDIVGLVGATGRVTGPHLHWALRVGPARVDPLSALSVLANPNDTPPSAPPEK